MVLMRHSTARLMLITALAAALFVACDSGGGDGPPSEASPSADESGPPDGDAGAAGLPSEVDAAAVCGTVDVAALNAMRGDELELTESFADLVQAVGFVSCNFGYTSNSIDRFTLSLWLDDSVYSEIVEGDDDLAGAAGYPGVGEEAVMNERGDRVVVRFADYIADVKYNQLNDEDLTDEQWVELVAMAEAVHAGIAGG